MTRGERRRQDKKAKKEAENKRKLIPTKSIDEKAIVSKPASKKWKSIVENMGILGVIATVLGIIGTVIGIIVGVGELCDRFKSDKEKDDAENTIKGKVVSPRMSDHQATDGSSESKEKEFVNDLTFDYDTARYKFPKLKGIHIKDLHKMPSLTFELGGNRIELSNEQLYRGVDLFYLVKNCAEVKLIIAAKEDRLYVSSKFTDLTGRKIGDMEFNRWKIYNGEFQDYRCTDKSFEVIDHQGYVVFHISFADKIGDPFVSLAGYFISPIGVYIVNPIEQSVCISKSSTNWKQEAETKIYKLEAVLKDECK